MNERIKELAEQATSVYQTMDGEWEEDFDKEKFAELIVRECADIADSTAMAFPVNGWIVADKIRKHFGVEDES